MAESLVSLTVAIQQDPATVSDRLLRASENASSTEAVHRLAREVSSALTVRDAKALVRVDAATRGAATATLVATQADATAGDEMHFLIPGEQRVTLTAVTGAADASAGEYSIDTSDTAVGASMDLAIKANPLLDRYMSSSAASGTVTLTARYAGSWAHNIYIDEELTTGTAWATTQFSGGDDILDQPTMDIVFGTPDITANDTISIGARKYTWKASASADGEITLSTTPATAATNFAAAVNADANLTGICTASVATATVTLTFVCDPRLAQHIIVAYTEANAGSVVPAGTVVGVTGAEAPILGSTVTGSSTTRTIGGRGAA